MNAKLTVREVKPLFEETTYSTGSETTSSRALGKLTFLFATRECPAYSRSADGSKEQRVLRSNLTSVLALMDVKCSLLSVTLPETQICLTDLSGSRWGY